MRGLLKVMCALRTLMYHLTRMPLRETPSRWAQSLPNDIQKGLSAAIETSLALFPQEWANMVYDGVIPKVVATTERESRQVQDIC
jgi:hypothetical protein